MKTVRMLCLTAAAMVAAPLAAQTTTAAPAGATGGAAPATGGSAVAAGATVYDTKEGVVGTVDSVTNGVAVVNTGTNKVGLPLASFATGPKGPIISMTKTELDAAASQATAANTAELKAQLAPGATVYGAAGASLGTIKESDDQYVTVTLEKGPVKLPIGAFTKGDKGAMLSMTAEQLEAAVAAAAPAQ